MYTKQNFYGHLESFRFLVWSPLNLPFFRCIQKRTLISQLQHVHYTVQGDCHKTFPWDFRDQHLHDNREKGKSQSIYTFQFCSPCMSHTVPSKSPQTIAAIGLFLLALKSSKLIDLHRIWCLFKMSAIEIRKRKDSFDDK